MCSKSDWTDTWKKNVLRDKEEVLEPCLTGNRESTLGLSLDLSLYTSPFFP